MFQGKIGNPIKIDLGEGVTMFRYRKHIKIGSECYNTMEQVFSKNTFRNKIKELKTKNNIAYIC